LSRFYRDTMGCALISFTAMYFYESMWFYLMIVGF